jgi:hypothetical protein
MDRPVAVSEQSRVGTSKCRKSAPHILLHAVSSARKTTPLGFYNCDRNKGRRIAASKNDRTLNKSGDTIILKLVARGKKVWWPWNEVLVDSSRVVVEVARYPLSHVRTDFLLFTFTRWNLLAVETEFVRIISRRTWHLRFVLVTSQTMETVSCWNFVNGVGCVVGERRPVHAHNSVLTIC